MGDSTGTQNQQALYGCTNCHEDYSWHAVELRVDDAGKCWCQDCWEYSDYVTTLGRWYELEPFIPLQTKRIKELEAQLADKEGQRAWLQNELDAALRRIDGLNAQRDSWQPIETAPPQKDVLLHYKTEYGFWLTIRAEFVPEATRDVDDQPYDGDAVYDKVTDRHWWPEGWYELIDNWGDMSCVMVHGAPYRWMLLPAAPDSATSAGDKNEK